jgi:plastocyanin
MRRPPVPLLLVAVLGLSACSEATVVHEPGRTVTISEHDYRFRPQRVQVHPGPITFLVRNDSPQPHNFQLRRGGRKRGRIATLKPGESGKLTVRLRRGSYTMYCGIGHHEQLGEYGTVVVR